MNLMGIGIMVPQAIRPLLVLPLIALCGCHSVACSVAETGRGIRDAGASIMGGAAISPVLLPFGIVLGTPPLVIGYPIYLSGRLFGGEAESDL